jgi:hypothetical protein
LEQAFNFKVALDPLGQFFIEHENPVASLCLDLVHRDIRFLDETVGVVVGVAATNDAHAYAGADANVVLVHDIAFLQFQDELPGDVERDAFTVRPFGKAASGNDELVAAQTRNR